MKNVINIVNTYVLAHQSELILVALNSVSMFGLGALSQVINNKKTVKPIGKWVIKNDDGEVNEELTFITNDVIRSAGPKVLKEYNKVMAKYKNDNLKCEQE